MTITERDRTRQRWIDGYRDPRGGRVILTEGGQIVATGVAEGIVDYIVNLHNETLRTKL